MFDIKSIAVYTAEEALDFFKDNTTRLILLDINLGNSSGFELCKKLRADYDIPILFISARSSDDDMVIALKEESICVLRPYQIGIDPFLVKIFLVKENIIYNMYKINTISIIYIIKYKTDGITKVTLK